METDTQLAACKYALALSCCKTPGSLRFYGLFLFRFDDYDSMPNLWIDRFVAHTKHIGS